MLSDDADSELMLSVNVCGVRSAMYCKQRTAMAGCQSINQSINQCHSYRYMLAFYTVLSVTGIMLYCCTAAE